MRIGTERETCWGRRARPAIDKQKREEREDRPKEKRRKREERRGFSERERSQDNTEEKRTKKSPLLRGCWRMRRRYGKCASQSVIVVVSVHVLCSFSYTLWLLLLLPPAVLSLLTFSLSLLHLSLPGSDHGSLS